MMVPVSQIRAGSLLKYSTGCIIAWMRCQNSDASRYFASREGLCPELGEVEKCHDGFFQRPARRQSLAAAKLRSGLGRSGWALVALAALAGCHQQTAPGDPFLPFMRSRVPPPGTAVPPGGATG